VIAIKYENVPEDPAQLEASWYEGSVVGELFQGEVLVGFDIGTDYTTVELQGGSGGVPVLATTTTGTLPAAYIIGTHSCDLIDGGVTNVLLVPVARISATPYDSKGKARDIAKGRTELIHMLAPAAEFGLTEYLICSFGAIEFSSRENVLAFSTGGGTTFRLRSPFLEHFAHALGRSVSRIALPDGQTCIERSDWPYK
jgi:hypothetical protein